MFHKIRILPLILFLFVHISCSTAQHTATLSISYTGLSLDISAETSDARATTWHPDGSAIFLVGRGTQNVVAYTLEEPWNIATASFSQSFDLSGTHDSSPPLSVPHGLYIREDGGKMWVFHRTEIWGYSLSESWDISTAMVATHAILSGFVRRGHDIDFYPDGTRLFIDDRDARAVHEVVLSTPWDVGTFTFVQTLDISDQEEQVRGIEFIHEGRTMLLLDTVRRHLMRYTLSAPYDLTTAVYSGAYDLSDNTIQPRGLSVHPDERTVYITERDGQRILQYVLME
jgi:sugar lactone lactonase YvrE